MIFYLENDAKFHLYYSNYEVIYIEYVDAIQAPMITTVRWINKLAFKNEHIETIVEYLKSDSDTDKDIGKSLLEETMKIKIYGRIVGHYEGTSI